MDTPAASTTPSASSGRAQAAPPTDRLVSAEELLDHPEWGPCELVNGKVVPMRPTGRPHGRIAGKLLGELYAHFEVKGLGQVFAAETGMYIDPQRKTVRAPDIMYIRQYRIPQDAPAQGFLTFAPDLVVEVVSPRDSFSDMQAKAEEYLGAGVTVVWIVDPANRTVHILRDGQDVKVLRETDTLRDEAVLPGWSVPLAKVFG